MKKLFAIVAGEPNSINSEIIVKAWKKIKNKKNFFIIGNYLILKKQLNKINQKINISEINSVDKMRSNNNLNILNIPLNFKSIFKVNPLDAKKYILQSLNIAHNLSSSKKIIGFINLPVNKSIFKNKYLGVTEYLADKNNVKNNEVMMIHNKKLSVVPLTTHLDIKNITKNIKYNLIKKKIFSLNKSYKYLFKRKPIIVVLGLNPHNSENRKNSIENTIIKPAIQNLRQLNINIRGPFAADTIFNNQNKLKFDVIVGMYHDQVLAPFKAIYGFDAINITLGLNYLRVSPDHGTAQDIVGQNKGNPQSLLSAINFFNKIND
jgi:4-hydroxythreonine-4-phosphate dehydrogenase